MNEAEFIEAIDATLASRPPHEIREAIEIASRISVDAAGRVRGDSTGLEPMSLGAGDARVTTRRTGGRRTDSCEEAFAVTRMILNGMIGLAVLAATPAAQANEATKFSSFDEVRIYFEPWEVLHVLAMTPESLIEAAPISVKIVGFTRPPRVAERVLLPEAADVTVEETQDVRLVIEFYHAGVLSRTAYATNQVLYDGSGRAIRRIDSGFKERFSALGLWESEEKDR